MFIYEVFFLTFTFILIRYGKYLFIGIVCNKIYDLKKNKKLNVGVIYYF